MKILKINTESDTEEMFQLKWLNKQVGMFFLDGIYTHVIDENSIIYSVLVNSLMCPNASTCRVGEEIGRIV